MAQARKLDSTLSAKDAARREMMLHAPVLRVLLRIATPLALYQGLNSLFKMLDTIMASHIGATSVSTVAYLSQLNHMLAAIGGGLAVGASIKISQAYGAGDYGLVKQRVNTMFALCALISVGLLLIFVPFAVPFLRLTGTPESFITEGARFFILNVFDMTLVFFNSVYFAVERARGNSKLVFGLNLTAVAVKLGLTMYFVYILGSGIHMIAVATLASDAVITLWGIVRMAVTRDAFSFSLSAIAFRREVAAPMVLVGLPVIAERLAFSFGKVVVNSMSTGYGDLTVGALGISNNINGMTTGPQNGYQEGGAAIVSQNLGAGSARRALDTFKAMLIVTCSIGLGGMIITILGLPWIVNVFAGDDPIFAGLISSIYLYEVMTGIPLGICASVTGLLYGFGYTRLTLIISFCRVFVFRVPVLWGLQRLSNMGPPTVGIVMLVSNCATALLAIGIAFFAVRHICVQYGVTFRTPKEAQGT